MTPVPRPTLWICVAGVLAVTAYAALAAVQILVLNPLAAAPGGLSLDEVRAAMSNAGESLMPQTVLGILGAGVCLGVGTAVVCLLTRAPAVVAGMTFLALLMGGAPAYFVASFGPGMGLADTFGISGADASPWALPLYAVSALSAVGVLVGAAVTSRRRGPSPATA
ncbi:MULTISPECIES: hypothetical protein [Microbacterium]|uniref:hypothetical protein n=1 Tax=Microbacterium TaxID=33882 RepID=UPI001657020B|nr:MULTISPECIES: hypothetical protein [Microbacterium]CAD5141843.1 conserved membrane protein of unknown function [Microbacterium sp. Nx66]